MCREEQPQYSITPLEGSTSEQEEASYRALYCSVLYQLLEDAFLSDRVCYSAQTSASANRVNRDNARNYFFSSSPDIVEDREILFEELCGLSNHQAYVEQVKTWIVGGRKWKDIKKEAKGLLKEWKKKPAKIKTQS